MDDKDISIINIYAPDINKTKEEKVLRLPPRKQHFSQAFLYL